MGTILLWFFKDVVSITSFIFISCNLSFSFFGVFIVCIFPCVTFSKKYKILCSSWYSISLKTTELSLTPYFVSDKFLVSEGNYWETGSKLRNLSLTKWGELRGFQSYIKSFHALAQLVLLWMSANTFGTYTWLLITR